MQKVASPKKSVARRKFPAVVVRKSSIHGRGLFAAERIPRGKLIGFYEGPRTKREGAYVLWVEDDDETFGVAGKNHLRFVNHSRKPNAYFDGVELWSAKVIRPGEEITFHYGADWE